MSLSFIFIHLLLSAHFGKGGYVRRAVDLSEDSPPVVPLPPGFGHDHHQTDTSSNQDQDASERDQGIRNGHAIAPLPWYAVFQSRTLCGAALIHGDILLTAAHCVDDNGLPPKVRVGSNDYYTGGRVTKVLDGVLHPGWTWSRASDPDLAVLLLEDFLPNQVAELNSDPAVPVANHESLFAMGFGLTNDKHTSRTLLGASIPYLDNCSSRSYTYDRTRHVCANSQRIATCGGDSGSPITLGPSSRLQVGINSYSNGKCSSQTLDIYTRVSFYYEWITEQVCQMSSNPPDSCFETDPPTRAPTVATEAPTPVPTSSPTSQDTSAPTTSISTPPPSVPAATNAPTIQPGTSGPTSAPTTGIGTSPPTSDLVTMDPTSSPSVPTKAPAIPETSAPTGAIEINAPTSGGATNATTSAPTVAKYVILGLDVPYHIP